jgi:hypothetical protein
MEEHDLIGDKFKSAFSDFEKEPPARVWENLSRELHPEPKTESFRSRLAAFSFFPSRQPGFYFALGGMAVILFLAVVYLASDDHHAVKGHAYAGDVRLCRGTAVLFKVADKSMPWDSATQYRSAAIDDKGHYQFPEVEHGKYLLCITPVGNSEASKKFLPSWFDQHANSDSCHLIVIDDADVDADVHLMEKGNSQR